LGWTPPWFVLSSSSSPVKTEDDFGDTWSYHLERKCFVTNDGRSPKQQAAYLCENAGHLKA
jgi:hypothetical protein